MLCGGSGRKRTPGLDLADADSLGVLLLVVAAEQVDVLVVLLLSGGGGLGGVEGDLGDLGAVDGVGLAGVAGQGRELVLVRGDVLVPAGRVGVLGGVGGGAQGLEDDGISLRGRVAVVERRSARMLRGKYEQNSAETAARGGFRGAHSAGCVIKCRS
jgi:hypothetical protein